jgi:GT2 family glycosyltransferase
LQNPADLREPLVYIIIVNYYGRELLRRCLTSLRKTKYGNYRALIVDNGSKDGSVEMVRREFSEVEVIALPKNFGYAGANNLGIVHALKHGAEYVVLLNNDTEVLDPCWLRLAVKVMERHKDIGILGFNLVLPSGKSQQHFNKTKPWEVDTVIFAAVMIRSQVFRSTGYLDPNYTIGFYEDIDFCYRARRCGFKVVYVPRIKVLHVSRATFRRVPHIALMLEARNQLRNFMLNASLSEWFKLSMWFIMAFIGIRSIEARNVARSLTYGFIVYVKESGFRDFINLLVESSKRRFRGRTSRISHS